MSFVPFRGQKKQLSREEAVERYILLRIRAIEISRLGFLLEALHDGRIEIPGDAPFTRADLKDTVRTAFYGWFATLTDKDERVVYAFDPLYALFPNKQNQICKVQVECEVCHSVLQQFRNNVAFHSRAEFAAHVRARRGLMTDDASLELTFARKDFQRLMTDLISEELSAIPELPQALTELGISHHPAFASVLPGNGAAPSQ